MITPAYDISRHNAKIIQNAALNGLYDALKVENRIQLAVYFSMGDCWVGLCVDNNSQFGNRDCRIVTL